MTRAIPVIVEKSPGGLNGWAIQVGPHRERVTSPGSAWPVQRAVDLMADARASVTERFRAGRLLASELRRRARVEVTAEVARG